MGKYQDKVVKEYREAHKEHCDKLLEEWRNANREHYNEQIRRWHKTPSGKAHLARMTAGRREHSTDLALYAARVELLHAIREPCAKCHNSYNITHQIDHIVALCLGGSDDWDNLQPLCILCHREKSKDDMRKLRALREEASSWSP